MYNLVVHSQYLYNCTKDEACLHKLLVHILLLTDGSHVCSCHTMLGDRAHLNFVFNLHCYIYTMYGSFGDIHDADVYDHP